MKDKPIILLDVDGVLADFTGRVLQIGNELTKCSYTMEDVKEWDVFSLYPKELKRVLVYHICREGFCTRLDVLPGALDGVKQLKEVGHVVAVTSPWWSSKTWMHERMEWLKLHFDIPMRSVIHTAAKELIRGDIMIDDKPENLLSWGDAQKGQSLSILVDAPYNRSVVAPVQRSFRSFIRATDWKGILDSVRWWLR